MIILTCLCISTAIGVLLLVGAERALLSGPDPRDQVIGGFPPPAVAVFPPCPLRFLRRPADRAVVSSPINSGGTPRRRDSEGLVNKLATLLLTLAILLILGAEASAQAKHAFNFQTVLAGDVLSIAGNIDLPDGCLIDWEARPTAHELPAPAVGSEAGLAGRAVVANRKFAATVSLRARQDKQVRIWVAVQPTQMGTPQPSSVSAIIGGRGQWLEGSDVVGAISGGPVRRLVLTQTIDLGSANAQMVAPSPGDRSERAELIDHPSDAIAPQGKPHAVFVLNPFHGLTVGVEDRIYDIHGEELPNPFVPIGASRTSSLSNSVTPAPSATRLEGCIVAQAGEYLLASPGREPHFLAVLQGAAASQYVGKYVAVDPQNIPASSANLGSARASGQAISAVVPSLPILGLEAVHPLPAISPLCLPGAEPAQQTSTSKERK